MPDRRRRSEGRAAWGYPPELCPTFDAEAARALADIESYEQCVRVLSGDYEELEGHLLAENPEAWGAVPGMPREGPSADEAERLAERVRQVAGPILAAHPPEGGRPRGGPRRLSVRQEDRPRSRSE